LVDAEGKVMRSEGGFALCRCGQSSNKPFCDGTHRDKFESVVRAE
jgi:CDGSH-type Zn-finger protein